MTEAEIQASTDSTLIRSEDGLAGYWNFDDETAKDLAVNDHDSELKEMPKLSVLPSLVMANRITNLDTNLSLMFLSRLGASTEQVYLARYFSYPLVILYSGWLKRSSGKKI